VPPSLPETVSCTQVQGYVRGVSDKGLFLALDRTHHGRVKKNQLSDGFIEDPAAAFPLGTLLTARVLSVQQQQQQDADGGGGGSAAAGRWSGRVLGEDGVRIELSLLSGEASGLRQIGDIKEGELTQGKVRCPCGGLWRLCAAASQPPRLLAHPLTHLLLPSKKVRFHYPESFIEEIPVAPLTHTCNFNCSHTYRSPVWRPMVFWCCCSAATVPSNARMHSHPPCATSLTQTPTQVTRVEPYGVFVLLHRSQVRGLVHVSQVERAFSKELAKHYTPGQVVSVR
jgi:predicted RNA-binding protein with RPS1 domain